FNGALQHLFVRRRHDCRDRHLHRGMPPVKDKPQHPDDPEARSGIGLLRKPVQWLVLFVLSAPLAVFFEIAGIPAGLMLGPMFAGVVVAINGGTIRLPRVCFFGVQVVLAMMIAGMVSPNLIDTFLSRWPIFLAIVLSVIAMSTLSGWVIARMGILPGTTAIW